MTQTRAQSLAEAVVNTAVGFVLSMAVVAYVPPLAGVSLSIQENFVSTCLMTFVSIVRSYALRRIFNTWHGGAR